MASERSPKRQRTSDNPSEQILGVTKTAPSPQPADKPTSNKAGTSDPEQSKSQRSSWYNSWSSKAPPVTQVARESIRSASTAATEAITAVTERPRSIRSPSLALTLGKSRPSTSSRALPIDATTTKIHATPESSIPTRKGSSKVDTPDGVKKPVEENKDHTAPRATDSIQNKADVKSDIPQEEQPPAEDVPKDDNKVPQDVSQDSRTSWLSWLAKNETTQNGPATQNELAVPESTEAPEPEARPTEGPSKDTEQPQDTNTLATKTANPVRRSWIPYWGGENQSTATSQSLPDTSATVPDAKDKQSIPTEIESTPVTQPPKAAEPVETSLPPAPPPDEVKPSGWAFWSRERKANDSTASVDKPHVGEIAVSDTPSQNRPKRASISVGDSKDKNKDEAVKDQQKTEPLLEGTLKPTMDRPENSKNEITPLKPAATKKVDVSSVKSQKKSDPPATKAESSNATAIAQAPIEDKKPASVRSAKVSQNLLLPELHSTLKLPENPSIIERLTRLLYITKEPELKHLSLVKEMPRLKNALAIGVHGYFPAPLIRTVLGQPTGTSIKFADMAAKSIKRWTAARGYECEVKTAALEGEGKIAERVELLWRLLLNWIDEIRKSDFVMIACHSQGVPVAIMLVAKLVQFGCISSARVGICAMAGVNMGPFSEYKSKWITGSAGELFEFSNPKGQVSIEYMAALDTVLKSGVRITFIGSIDDQLVSLESSIFSPIQHPHIYRAVSIDAKVHAPNFLSHLVGFALKLRNLGIHDHGLIRELSPPLAGSLYSGEGHSRIYEDDAVYDMALSFALETNTMTGLSLSQRPAIGGSGANPYILPFAMRGMLEEDFVKNELQGEASQLLQQFDDWKPTTKVLKDVKFRLEGIRSKL